MSCMGVTAGPKEMFGEGGTTVSDGLDLEEADGADAGAVVLGEAVVELGQAFLCL